MASSEGFLSGSEIHPDLFNGKMRAKMAQTRQDYDRKVYTYEKEFNINMSRITNRERHLRDSMLSYSEHAKSVSQRRMISDSLPDVSLLRVRARNIPSIEQTRQLPALVQPVEGNVAHKPSKTSKNVDVFQKKMTSLRSEQKEEKNINSDSFERKPVVATLPVNNASQIQKSNKEELHMNSVSASDLDKLVDTKRKIRLPPKPNLGLPRIGHESSENNNYEPDMQSEVIPDESPSARAERARKRRESRTRMLLRDAIASLQAMEENTTNPLFRLPPRTKKGKRLKLHKGTLDAIPENNREEDVVSGYHLASELRSLRHVPVEMTSSRSEPSYKSSYRHKSPPPVHLPTIDGAHMYAVQSDPFDTRSLRNRKPYMHPVSEISLDTDHKVNNRRRTSLTMRTEAEYTQTDVRNKERKRKRLQQHAKAKLSKPPRIKFLKDDQR